MPNNTGLKFGGRQKGTRNLSTINAKNAIEECFRMLGGVDALHEWAKENLTDFYKVIWPKIIPLTLVGDKDNPITFSFLQALNELSGRSAGLPDTDKELEQPRMALEPPVLH